MEPITLGKKFVCAEKDGRIDIEFNTNLSDEELLVRPSDHEFFRGLGQVVKNREVYLHGKAPNETYAAAAFYLTQFHPRRIVCHEFHYDIDVLIYDEEVTKSQMTLPERKWFKFSVKVFRDTIEVIGNNDDPRGIWGKDVFDDLETLALPDGAGNNPAFCLTGNGSQVLYAALASAAARFEYNELVVDKPQEPNLLAFNDRVAGRELPKDTMGVPPGRCLGILGDPNSGKSVCSRTLFNCIRDLYPPSQVWVYDCDMSSPTPNWYMRALSSGDPQRIQAAKARREELKTNKWNENKERDVAHALQTLKSNIQLTIADLPGGKHPNREKGQDFPPQRIPGPTRAEMMSQCDAFIVLCRKDKPNVFDDWMDALREYGLQDRVIAKVISDAPNSPPAVSELATDENGLLTCEICGLGRENGGQLAVALKPTLKKLGVAIQRHFGQSYEVL